MAGEQRETQSAGSEYSKAATVWESILAEDDGEENAAPAEEPEPQEEEEEPEAPESDEDESEEDESEEDEEGNDDDEEEEEPTGPEIDPEAKVKVVVDGEEEEVTFDELKKGYSRNSHFTRSMQKLAEDRKQVEQERSEILSQKQEWGSALEQVQNYLKAGLSGRTEEQWQQLRQEDEYRYHEERERERVTRGKLQAIEAENQKVQKEAEQEQQRRAQEQYRQYLQEEQDKLIQKKSEWADSATFQKDAQKIKAYGESLGYTAQEIASLADHRALMVLHDAARYRELVAAREKGVVPKKTKTKTLKPGTPKNEAPSKSKARKAADRHRKERSVKSAASVFESILNSE